MADDEYYEVRHYHLHALYAVQSVEVTTEESLSATKVSYVGEGFFVEPAVYKQGDRIKVELQVDRSIADNWCPVILNGYVLDVKGEGN